MKAVVRVLFALVLVGCLFSPYAVQRTARGVDGVTVFLPMIVRVLTPRVVFTLVENQTNGEDIWVVKHDGTGLAPLVAEVGMDFQPAWSPTGNMLAYISQEGTDLDLCVIKPDGTGRRCLTESPDEHESYPTWSPDGQRIAFEAVMGGLHRLCVIAPDGTDPQCYPGDETSNKQYLAWSPKGDWIAYQSAGQIKRVNPETWEERTIVNQSGVYAYEMFWSPNGEKLAVRGEINCPSACDQEIFLVNADGNGLVNLTNRKGVDMEPSWSPDGARMVYECYPDICVMNSDGSGAAKITNDTAADLDPGWSKYQNLIVFAKRLDNQWYLYLTDINKSFVRQLSVKTNVYTPEWDW